MKRFDWFTTLAILAIIENTIFMISRGGIWIILGVMFGAVWVWVGYWDITLSRKIVELDAKDVDE